MVLKVSNVPDVFSSIAQWQSTRLLTEGLLVRAQLGEFFHENTRKELTEQALYVGFHRSWLRGQAVKTSPFHGGNTGSIPVGVTACDK